MGRKLNLEIGLTEAFNTCIIEKLKTLKSPTKHNAYVDLVDFRYSGRFKTAFLKRRSGDRRPDEAHPLGQHY
jgi:hypothetical protein